MFGLISKASSANYTRFDPIDPSFYISPMAMGKRKRDRQPTMWVTTTDLPTAASHPFYTRLNQLLREHGFDAFAEAQCVGVYAETMGRPGLPLDVYFRLLLIGYFEGIRTF
jgi:transposase